MERVYFHGNNKGPEELALALDWDMGRVVVDNFHEMAMLDRLAAERGVRQDVLLRLSPAIDPHTHHHTTTGVLDSKFGFAIANGQAEEAVKKALGSSALDLVGLHVHLGSPIFEMDPFAQGIGVTLGFAAQMRDQRGLDLREFSPGGGFAIQYTPEQPAPAIDEYAEVITSALKGRLRAVWVQASPSRHRARARGRRQGRCSSVYGRRQEGDPGCPHLRLRGRRHGGQHQAGDLRFPVCRSLRRLYPVGRRGGSNPSRASTASPATS